MHRVSKVATFFAAFIAFGFINVSEPVFAGGRKSEQKVSNNYSDGHIGEAPNTPDVRVGKEVSPISNSQRIRPIERNSKVLQPKKTASKSIGVSRAGTFSARKPTNIRNTLVKNNLTAANANFKRIIKDSTERTFGAIKSTAISTVEKFSVTSKGGIVKSATTTAASLQPNYAPTSSTSSGESTTAAIPSTSSNATTFSAFIQTLQKATTTFAPSRIEEMKGTIGNGTGTTETTTGSDKTTAKHSQGTEESGVHSETHTFATESKVAENSTSATESKVAENSTSMLPSITSSTTEAFEMNISTLIPPEQTSTSSAIREGITSTSERSILSKQVSPRLTTEVGLDREAQLTLLQEHNATESTMQMAKTAEFTGAREIPDELLLNLISRTTLASTNTTTSTPTISIKKITTTMVTTMKTPTPMTSTTITTTTISITTSGSTSTSTTTSTSTSITTSTSASTSTSISTGTITSTSTSTEIATSTLTTTTTLKRRTSATRRAIPPIIARSTKKTKKPKIAKMPTLESFEEAKRSRTVKSSGKGGLIAGIVIGMVVVVAIVFAGLFVMFQIKRRELKNQQQQQQGQLPPTDGASEYGAASSLQNDQRSDAVESEWAPDKIKASQFSFKGPLQIPFKQPLILKHELDDEKPASVHENQHVQFDDALNEVHEMGSEVEVIVFGGKQKKAPKSVKPSTRYKHLPARVDTKEKQAQIAIREP